MGRFITEDPIKDGNNWYIYAANNPLKYTDPTGLYTTQYGLSYAAGGGAGGTQGIGVAFSWNKENPSKLQFGYYTFQGLGAHFGSNISGSFDFGFSTNSNIFDLGGPALAIGLSGGLPGGPAWAGMTTEGSISLTGADTVYALSLSGGLGTPFEGHTYYTDTQVNSLYEFDLTQTLVYSFIENLYDIGSYIFNGNQDVENNGEG